MARPMVRLPTAGLSISPLSVNYVSGIGVGALTGRQPLGLPSAGRNRVPTLMQVKLNGGKSLHSVRVQILRLVRSISHHPSL